MIYQSFMILMLLSSCMFKDGKYVDDNIAEEVVEELIEIKTGIDVDLTPNSEEKGSIVNRFFKTVH